MTRLDQLAQPVRRNGEHIRAIIERERQQALELEKLSRESATSRHMSPADDMRRKSRSMSQLAHRGTSSSGTAFNKNAVNSRSASSTGVHRAIIKRQGMMKRNDKTSKSMSQLTTAGIDETKSTRASISRSERLRHQVKEQLSNSLTVPAAGANTNLFYSLSTLFFIFASMLLTLYILLLLYKYKLIRNLSCKLLQKSFALW